MSPSLQVAPTGIIDIVKQEAFSRRLNPDCYAACDLHVELTEDESLKGKMEAWKKRPWSCLTETFEVLEAVNICTTTATLLVKCEYV